MLILENFSFQAAKRSFTNTSRRLIKISIKQHIATTQNTGKVKSGTLVEWSEAVSLPLFLNAQYNFQIYEKHDFGYNPQQLNIVAGGKFTISQNDSFSSWQVTSDRGLKMGFLSFNIRKKMRYAPDVSTDQSKGQIVTISSIIAHLISLKQKRGYIVLNVLNKQYRTEIAKSKSGELLFTETMDIEKTDDIIDAKVEVYSFDAKEQKSELIATGTLIFNAEHPEKRVIVKNDKGLQAGDVFFDYKITLKDVYAASKQLTRIVQKASMLNRSAVNQSRVDNSITNHSRTLNNQSYGAELLVSSRGRSDKKVSVVNHNNNIYMPTQKRFMNYVDKQNNNISYLRERDPFDFKDPHSKNYYKGASIGVGDKFDFTHLHKSNPGVGVYNLPSIWDRY